MCIRDSYACGAGGEKRFSVGRHSIGRTGDGKAVEQVIGDERGRRGEIVARRSFFQPAEQLRLCLLYTSRCV